MCACDYDSLSLLILDVQESYYKLYIKNHSILNENFKQNTN